MDEEMPILICSSIYCHIKRFLFKINHTLPTRVVSHACKDSVNTTSSKIQLSTLLLSYGSISLEFKICKPVEKNHN